MIFISIHLMMVHFFLKIKNIYIQLNKNSIYQSFKTEPVR